MEIKLQKINRLAKEIFRYSIFCGNYFFVGYDNKEDAAIELNNLKEKYPKDNWLLIQRKEL